MPRATNKLQEWANQNTVNDKMLWKGSFGAQVVFVRDYLTRLVGAGLDYEQMQGVADVISTHRSKSIILPVYELSRPDLGLRFILRDNFYNWKLSVISEKPIEADFSGLFYTTPPVEPDYTGNPLSPVYFEGFPGDLIFGYYEQSDRRKWSAEIIGDYDLYATIRLIMRSVGAIRPRVWSTRESYQKQRDAERMKNSL